MRLWRETRPELGVCPYRAGECIDYALFCTSDFPFTSLSAKQLDFPEYAK